MGIDASLWGSKNMQFRQCIAFHPNNLVHLVLTPLPTFTGRLSGFNCSLQLRPCC